MKSRYFGWIVMLAVIASIAAASLFACSESCLDEYPCNVPADDPDANSDSGGDAAEAAVSEDASVGEADSSDAADD